MTFIAALFFAVAGLLNAEAASGSCAGHGGVNCLAGPSPSGYLKCYDNSTTSVPYYQTGECNADMASGCVSPTSTGCMEYYTGCLFPSLQRQIEVCGNEINIYQIERQAYQQCLSNYYQTIFRNVSATYTAELRQKINACIMNYGYTWDTGNNKCIGTDLLCAKFGANSRIFNGADEKTSCICDSGYARNASDTACVPYTDSAASSSSAAATISLAVNLNLGASGNDVIVLQRFLQGKNFLKIPAGVKEGYFGTLTKKAVADFQKSAGLPATGYCGPLTRAVINKQL